MSQLSDSLLKLEIFKNFYTEEIEILTEYISSQKFYKSQVLMSKGGLGAYVGIILRGQVNIIDDGKLIAARGVGELLGEIALIRSSPRTADVVAASEGEIGILTFDDIDQLQIDYPNIAVRLISILTKSTIKRLLESDPKQTKSYIAMLATDEDKIEELLVLAREYRDFFLANPLTTTSAIAERLEDEVGIKVTKVLYSGALMGGDQAIGSLLITKKIKAVICLKSTPIMGEQSSLESLCLLCDLHDVLLATNMMSAKALIYYMANA